MTEADQTDKQGGQRLTPPTKELAEQVLRKVAWEERATGYIYDPGPGNMPEWILKLEELYNLLSGLPNFFIDFRELRQWIGETLGDKEASEAIQEAIADRTEEEARPLVVALLEERLSQSKAVLNPDSEKGDEDTDEGLAKA